MSRTGRWYLCLVCGALAWLLTVPAGLSADACATPYSVITTGASTDTINLQGVNGGAGVCSACMSAAANAWNSACTPDQTPRFQQGGSGGIQVHVDFFSGTNPGTITGCSSDRCACTSTTISNGTITGATVRLWQSAAGTANCQGSWNGILTHELGHALGLQDALACSNRIMGNVGAGILGADCDGADLNFLSGVERNPPDPDKPCTNPPV